MVLFTIKCVQAREYVSSTCIGGYFFTRILIFVQFTRESKLKFRTQT